MGDKNYYGSGGGGGGGGPKQQAGGSLDQGKIFVGGLSWQTTEESLRWHFEQYGPVVSVEVMKDRVTGDPRGFAFVVFQESATVDLVMKEGKHEINHKIVDVKRAQARGIAPPSIHRERGEEGGEGDDGVSGDPRGAGAGASGGHGGGGGGGSVSGGGSVGGGDHHRSSKPTPEQMGNKVFVGGIPPSVDRDELKSVFEKFGPVVDAIVMIDQATNRSRCFGFVTFENGSNGAQRVIEAQPLSVAGRNVEVKLATPKAEQRRLPPAAGPKHVGLRAAISSSSGGKYAGLAVAYGRSGWKAGYGTIAFGKGGWSVQGWEDGGGAPEKSGFSFSMLQKEQQPEEKQQDVEPQQQQQQKNRSNSNTDYEYDDSNNRPRHDAPHQSAENHREEGRRSKRRRR